MNAPPSILDLGRHHGAMSDAHDRIDEAMLTDNSPAMDRLAHDATHLWLERRASIIDLILTMPAVTLADVGVQLEAAISAIDDEYKDPWPKEARKLTMRLRRVLVSTAMVAMRDADVDPGIMGYHHLADMHRQEFPLALLDLPTATATPRKSRRAKK